MGVSRDFFAAGLARHRRALAGMPDRVPVTAQMHEFVLHARGLPARDYYAFGDDFADATLEVMQRYGFDVPVFDYDVYNVEAEALGQAMIYSDRLPPDVDRERPLVTGRDDLKKLRRVDFTRAGRCAALLRAMARFAELSGTPPGVNFCAPFSLAANLRGIERLLEDIWERPRFAREQFSRITGEVLAPWIDHQLGNFPDTASVTGSDATASLPIVSPALLEDWVLPYIAQLRGMFGSRVNVPNWVGERHLKDPAEMLALKLQAAPGQVVGQDPDVEHLGPAFYRRYADDHGVPLVLGIGAGFLARASPEAVTVRVRDYIAAGGPRGRLVLYCCDLSAATPPANARAVIRAAREHGTYPLERRS